MGDDNLAVQSAEINSMKQDVGEIKGDVKGLQTSINKIEVMLAGNYITRKEFDKHKTVEEEKFEKHEEKERTGRHWWAMAIISGTGVMFTIVKIFKL